MAQKVRLTLLIDNKNITSYILLVLSIGTSEEITLPPFT
jgi:hypothetical protein